MGVSLCAPNLFRMQSRKCLYYFFEVYKMQRILFQQAASKRSKCLWRHIASLTRPILFPDEIQWNNNSAVRCTKEGAMSCIKNLRPDDQGQYVLAATRILRMFLYRIALSSQCAVPEMWTLPRVTVKPLPQFLSLCPRKYLPEIR